MKMPFFSQRKWLLLEQLNLKKGSFRSGTPAKSIFKQKCMFYIYTQWHKDGGRITKLNQPQNLRHWASLKTYH